MATMGLITYYATKVAYDLELSLREGYVRSGIPTELAGGYLGQVITNTAGNEYYIVNRGTDNWANLWADVGIAAGTFLGWGFETATLASARSFATAEFQKLAEKLAAGQQIDEIILTGHSLGYAESLAQYAGAGSGLALTHFISGIAAQIHSSKSNAFSGGRATTALLLRTTMGRSIRIG